MKHAASEWRRRPQAVVRALLTIGFGAVAALPAATQDLPIEQPLVEVQRALPVTWQLLPTVSRPLSFRGMFTTLGTGLSVSATAGEYVAGVASLGVHADLTTDWLFGGVSYPGGYGRSYDGNLSLSASRFFALGRLLNAGVRVRAGAFSGTIAAVPDETIVPAPPVPEIPFSLGFAAGIDLEIGLALLARTDLMVGVSYDRYFGYNDYVTVRIGTRTYNEAGALAFHGPSRRGVFQGEAGPPAGPHIRILEAETDPVFPVLRNFYETNPFGEVSIANVSEFDLSEVRVVLSIPDATDTPTLIAELPSVRSGETFDSDLSAVFAASVLNITESRTINALLKVDYTILDYRVEESVALPLDFVDRNAVQWDDDRKIASFMSVRDEAFKRISNRAIGLTRRQIRPAIDRNLQQAMIVFEALNSLGLSYVIDPSSAYEQLSQSNDAIDYVQFPRQTLYYRAGDCDDLSVAFNTLLESLGIETAFITTPGHIFTAFRLAMDGDRARRTFADPNRIVILEDGSAWMPIETTILDRGFTVAWASGAQQWHESNRDGTAGFFRTRDAWAVYPPVQPVGSESLDEVDGNTLEDRFGSELDSFVRQQVEPAEASLRSRLERRPNDVRSLNRLAVLYGRFGLLDEALEVLEPLVDELGYTRATVNLANTLYLAGDLGSAIARYGDALAADPNDSAALAGAAQAYFANGDFAESDAVFQRLLRESPGVASQLAYVGASDQGARASASAAEPSLFWGEEEDQ